jgi:hypothetical protein
MEKTNKQPSTGKKYKNRKKYFDMFFSEYLSVCKNNASKIMRLKFTKT